MMQSWARSRLTETRLKAILNLSLINLATTSRLHNAKANFICSRFFCGAKDVHTQSETARRRTAIDTLHMSGALD